MSNSLSIRLSRPGDLPALVTIYNQAIRSGNATGDLDEFTVVQRSPWFEQFDTENYPLYIAEIENKIVGYCSISPYRKGRKAMQYVAEISYYVDYAFHRQGVASSLISYAIKDCKRIEKKHLLAILMDSNIASKTLLEKFHFKQWGLFPNIIEIDDKRRSQVIYGLKIRD